MEWISVKDRLPEYKETVISTDGSMIAITTISAHTPEKFAEGKYYWQLLSSGCGCCDRDLENVTHWMPLPKLPEAQPCK